MMTPNHALTGLFLGLTITRWQPELVWIAAVAGFVGGGFPDFDLLFTHRKTFHFPVYYGLTTAGFLVTASILDSTLAVIGMYFFGAAAIHCYTDYFVAIQKDDDDASDKGVLYLHPRNRWIGPKKIIRYAGSLEDLLVGVLIAVLPLLYYSGVPLWLTAASLIWSVLYTGRRQYRRWSSK